MKDYKLLWEATKLDLKDQVAYSARLADEIKSLEDQLTSIKTGDTVNLRERIAMMVASQGWFQSTARDIFDWITDQTPVPAEKPVMVKGKRGPKKGIKRGPYKKINGNAAGGKMRDAVKPKRKYTKKSKFWAKKKK